MPSVWSKLLMPEWSLPYNCYEIGHTWTPCCEEAALEMTFVAFKESLKLYTPLYVFNAIMRQKFDKKAFQSLVNNIVRSSAFIAFSAYSIMTFFCSLRRYTGKFYYTMCAYLPVFVSSLLAILIEKRSRRGSLAIYCANIASETVYRMLVNRNYIKPIPRGEVILFTISISLLLYTIRRNGYTKDPISIAFKTLLGREDCPNCKRITNIETTERKEMNFNDENSNQYKQIRNGFEMKSKRFLSLIEKYFPRHSSCNHSINSCAINSFYYFVRNFSIGWTAQVLLSTVMKPKKLLKLPKDVLLKRLFDKNNIYFGLFLGCFTAIYKMTNCSLKWITNKSEDWHSLIAAICAGPSMLLSRSPMNTTLTLYLIWKCIEMLYIWAYRKGWVSYKDQTIMLLYAMSTAQLGYVTILEPRAMRPSYLKFIDRISGGRLRTFNRLVLNIFGTEASKGYEHIMFPKLSPEHTTREFKENIINWLI